MTKDILISKGIQAKHISDVKLWPLKPHKKIPMLSGEKHLSNFLKNHYEKDETKNHKHSVLVSVLNRRLQ